MVEPGGIFCSLMHVSAPGNSARKSSRSSTHCLVQLEEVDGIGPPFRA
jgi:hypothetical protein